MFFSARAQGKGFASIGFGECRGILRPERPGLIRGTNRTTRINRGARNFALVELCRAIPQIAEPLVENPDDTIRVWIDEDAVTVDEGRAYSARLPNHGRSFRDDLAGRHGTPVAGVFLRRWKRSPIWMRPSGRAWLRRQR